MDSLKEKRPAALAATVATVPVVDSALAAVMSVAARPLAATTSPPGRLLPGGGPASAHCMRAALVRRRAGGAHGERASGGRVVTSGFDSAAAGLTRKDSTLFRGTRFAARASAPLALGSREQKRATTAAIIEPRQEPPAKERGTPRWEESQWYDPWRE